MRVLAAVAAFTLAACSGSPGGVIDAGTAGSASEYPLWGWPTGSVALFGSKDDGATWVRLADEPSNAVGAVKVGSTLIVVAKNGTVWRSEDQGDTWQSTVISGLPSSGVWSVAAGATHVYVGAQGAVARSSDRGATWSVSSAGLPPSAQVEAMTEHGSTLLVAASLNGLFRSSDSGQTFTASAAGIPAMVSNNAVSTGLATWGGKVFAAFQGSGVYASSDEGQSWTLASSGLPATGLSRIWPGTTRLFASPPGQGLFATTDGLTWAPTCALPMGESVLQLTTSGSTLFLVTTNQFTPGFFISRDSGATCTAGGQPKSSSGTTDPLMRVFVK